MKERKFGFDIERDEDGTITVLTFGGQSLQVGSTVKANGRFSVPAGTVGEVVHFLEPYESPNTTDIIMVLFEGRRSPEPMKFKDLVLGS